jgi:hypothetical protein
MSRKKSGSIVIENGQERDLADSRESSDRERELRKLAKDCL